MANSFLTKLSRATLRLPLDEKIIFTKHLSMMIRSGMSEVESLELVREQMKGKSVKRMFDELIQDIQNGQFLSNALIPYKRTFGELFINIIKLGETSGTLSENLDFLSEELKESKLLRSKIKSALIYPIIILIATIGITALLVFFVLPKILPTLTSLGGELPITTKLLVLMTEFISTQYISIIASVFISIFIWSILMRLEKFKYIIHRIFLSLPLIKGIMISYNMANISRTLRILLQSGVKIVEGLRVSGEITENRVYKKALNDISNEVSRGEPINEYMNMRKKLFPSTMTRMIEVGEKTGNLDDNLKYLSEFYKEEVDGTVKNLSSVLEPLLLVIMGGIVGYVAISIITPIYSLTQSVAN